jgi:hypothetical protein
LKFDNEIHKNLIFMLSNVDCFSEFPKIFGNPICNHRNKFQIFHKRLYILNFIGKDPR